MRTLLCLFLVCVVVEQRPVCAECVYCPFANTVSESRAAADVIVVAKWKSSRKLPRSTANHDYYDGLIGKTTYEISEVLKNTKNSLNGETQITVDEFRSGKPNELVLLFGWWDPSLIWGNPTQLTHSSLAYIKALPKPLTPEHKRLAFFLQYFEHPHKFIAEDAYMEFLNASFSDIQKVAHKLPREQFRKWIGSEKTSAEHVALYGELLGMCGNQKDAKFLGDIIKQPGKNILKGMGGIMSGYLLLTGEEGLKRLEETKLKPGLKTSFGEIYGAIGAMRFIWNYGNNIKPERIKSSMRMLIHRPETAELAIAYLIRWEDWSVQDLLMERYHLEDCDNRTKQTIVKYLIASRKDSTNDDNGNPSQQHAKDAAKHLMHLRNSDPETVKRSEQSFNVLPY